MLDECEEEMKKIHEKINIRPQNIEDFLAMKEYLQGEQLNR